MRLSLTALALWCPLAHAQEAVPEFDAQNVRPSIDARRTLLTDDSGLAPSGTMFGKLVFSQANSLLTFTRNRDNREVAVLKDLMMADLIFGYSVSRLRVGLDVPVVLAATSDIADTQGGVGDVAVDLRGTILDPMTAPIGIAVATRFGAPTASVDLPIGGSGLAYETSLIVDKRFGSTLAAVNIGYRGRPPTELDNITIDDQLATRVGLGYEISPRVGVSGDVVGYVLPSDFANEAGGAWEGLIGGWYRPSDIVIRVGAGSGLSQGIGTSAYRTMLSVGWEPEVQLDSDSDGMLNSADQCPDEPEDLDGFEDNDGCPDELNPVRLLFRDPYGYPIDDLVVLLENEDDGSEVKGEARFNENLTPGIWNVSASAAGFYEFEDDFTVEEGTAVDRVFVLNPQVSLPKVRVTRRAIRITDKIYFETNSATIKFESFALLDAIAATMLSNPSVRRVRVEGHTDSRASDAYNLTLSQDRSEAVREYLIRQGVPSDRLNAVGRGEREPLDARENPDAWELNRRVEFIIEERSD
tara:strand:- start:686 stop:2263 length:1578 start_codon:yes stop_codon:yes gene_type:complete